MKHRLSRAVSGVAAAAFIASMTGCTLLVDFTECQIDADCPVGGSCVESICEAPSRVSVTDHIVKDTTWTNKNIYVLDNLIMVVAPAVLTIEPGTLILGKRKGLGTFVKLQLAEGVNNDPQVRFQSWGVLGLSAYQEKKYDESVSLYRKALEMCGAAGVRVVEEECRAKGGAVCRYAISWR